MPGSFTKFVGDTLDPYVITATNQDGSIIDLTTASLSLKMDSIDGSNLSITGNGTWMITDPTNGGASYSWDAADLSSPGLFLLYTIVQESGKYTTLDPVLVMILPAP